MNTEFNISLSADEVAALKRRTGKRTAAAAINALVDDAVTRARLAAEYPIPHTPNAATVRALRSKAKGKLMSGDEFRAMLRAIPARR